MSESERPAEPIPVAQFEGEFVRQMSGKLPMISLDMDEGYQRGTRLRLMVEVRVRNVRYEENRRGDLVREHVFALEEVQLVSAFNPEQAVDDVAGSASAHPTPTPEDTEQLGVQFKRSSDQWAPEQFVRNGVAVDF